MRLLGLLVLAGAALGPPSAWNDPPDTQTSNHVIVIGETHGTNELPDYVAKLLDHLVQRGPVVIGLELNPDSSRLPCNRSGELPASWKAESADGRSSLAMRALVCHARAVARTGRVQVVYLRATDQAFDEMGAEAFTRRFSPGTGRFGVILTGNLHARNSASSLAGHLRLAGLHVTTATVSTNDQAARAWQCRADGCGEKAAQAMFCPVDVVPNRPEWIKSPDPRWDHCLVVPTLSASAPAAGHEPKHDR
jgi:hypothetical protein